MAQKNNIDAIKSAVRKSTGLSAYQNKKASSIRNTAVKNQGVKTPKRTDDEIIKEYESIPNHNILSRGFSGVSSSGAGRPSTQAETDYNRKQELYKDYRQAKNRQIYSFIADNNISETSLTNAKLYNDNMHPDSFFKGAMTSSAIVGSYDYDNIKKLADANGIDMKDILEYKESTAAQKAKEENTKYADEHGVIGTLASVPVNIYGSAANLIDNTGNWLSGNPIGSNETINAFSDTAMSMRNAVSENIDSPVGKFVYNVGTSIADNVALMPLGPGISLAGMGAEAASGTLNDMKDKNVTPNQMMGTAATSGLIEVLTEKIPLDNLFKIARTQGRQTAREIILNVLKNAGAEGVGEGISEIANSIADYAINQDESNWSQLVKYYENLGMTKTQAENQAYLQFGLNAVQASAAGAVSGGLMAGGASAFANANSNIITPEQFQANEEYIQRLKSINDGQNYLDSYNERVEKVPDMRDLSTFQNGVSSDSQNNSDTDAYAEMLDRVQAVPRNGFEQKISDDIKNSHPTGVDATNTPQPLRPEQSVGKAMEADNTASISDSIPNSEENVNEAAQNVQYSGKKIDGFDDLNKDLDRLIGMYKGNENTQSMYEQMKSALNEYVQTYNKDAAQRAIALAASIDESLVGHSYTRKGSGKSSAKSQNNRVTTTFSEGEFVDTLLSYNRSLTDAARSNSESTNQTINPESVRTSYSDATAKSKKNYVVSAYKTKAANQSLDARAPQDTSENAAENTAFVNDSISNLSENVNANQKKRSYNDTFVEKTDAPQELKNEFIDNPDMYTALSNADTKAKADAILNENSTDSALTKFRQLLDSKSPEAVPLGYSLSKKLYQEGRIDESVQLVRDMSRALTEAGQFSQAAAITMLNNDPEAAKRYIIRELDSLNQKGREKYGKKWTDFELTDAELQQFDSIEPGDTDAIKSAYQSIYNRISKQYPSTMTEKLLEFRRVSMLLNVRTNVRNVVSNALLYPVRWTADRVSALGEGVYSLIDPKYQRTQSINPIRSKRAKQLASEAFETVRTELLGDNKYEDSRGAIRDRQIFKGTKLSQMLDNVTNGAITKANQLMGKDVNPSIMETARNFTYWLLEKGDDVFVKKNFESRMASYIDAQGITDLESIPADAYTLATQEAFKATFKDDSFLANTMSSFRQLLNRIPGNFVGDAVMPFTKTPANLAMRGIDYSPAGAYNVFKTIKNAKNNTDIAKGITQLGQTLTGTAAIALGYALAEAGIITGELSEDKDEAQFQKQQGKLAYSVKTPFGYLSYDFAQPASVPIILGVTLYDSMNNNGDAINGLKQGFLAASDSWLELSPLQNLSDIFGGYGTPAENVWDVLSTDLPLSFIPAQLGAATKIGDTTQRVTYDQNSYWNNLLNQVKAKIPGLSETLPVAYDTWGNPIKRQDSTAEAAFANLLNPGQFGNSNVTPIDGEISRLYDSTGDSAIFPRKADWSPKTSNGTVKLNNEQYSEYQRIMGTNSFDMASALIESAAYNSLSDEQRVKAISEMYSFASALAKSEVLGYDVENSDTYKNTYSIYKEKGAEGVAVYLGIKQNQEGTNIADKFSAVDSMELSDDDKGYYLSRLVDVSNAASSIQSTYGDAGLYKWYSMRSKVDSESDMPYQIVQSGMPYEDMLNYASVLYEDGKKKTAREKAADAMEEAEKNLAYEKMLERVKAVPGANRQSTSYESMLERVQAVPRTNSSLTPLGNSAYEEMLKRVQAVPR